MGLQQRLLHQVRWVELALKLMSKLQPGQQQQVISIRFQGTHGNDPFMVRAERTYGLLTDEPAKLSARAQDFARRHAHRRRSCPAFGSIVPVPREHCNMATWMGLNQASGSVILRLSRRMQCEKRTRVGGSTNDRATSGCRALLGGFTAGRAIGASVCGFRALASRRNVRAGTSGPRIGSNCSNLLQLISHTNWCELKDMT
jgi:hypothetical protein